MPWTQVGARFRTELVGSNAWDGTDSLLSDLNEHIPVNTSFKCRRHGCLFHSIFISYRVAASSKCELHSKRTHVVPGSRVQSVN